MVEIQPQFQQALADCQTFSCKKFALGKADFSLERKGKVLSSVKKGSQRKRNTEQLEEVREIEDIFKRDKQAFF